MTCLTIDERNDLVTNYLPLAEKLAWKKNQVTPKSITIDELKSAAYLGLIDAANKFKKDKGSFGKYASFRINGEIKDYLRELGRFSFVSMDAGKDEEFSFSSIFAQPEENKPQEFFEEVTKGLNALGKKIIKNYYIDDLSLKEIGSQINVGASRVSQILSKCRISLKKSWSSVELRAAV